MVQKRCVLFLLATCLFTFSIYAQNLAVRNRTTTNHEVFAPYWTMEPGWHTDLEIRNNNISSKVTVTPVLRTAEGVEVQLDELTLQPNEVKSISLMDALGKRAPQLLHRANAYGSVKVRYVSVNAANIYASVMIHREGHPIAFHMDTFEANPEFKAGSYESIWWLPSSTTESYFVVTNLSDMPYKGDLAVSDAAGLTKSLPAAIGPRQTKRFTDRELISHFGFGGELGGIAVSFTSGAGNIQVAHVGFDETNGFSTLMKVFGKDPSSAVSAVSLRAPTVALSLPDPALHFPDGTSMQSQVWLRNTSEKALSVQAQVDWRSSDAWGRSEPLTISLAPRQTRVLDLSQLQTNGAVASFAQWATVNLSYSGKDGDLVPIATSFAEAGRLLVQSPFSDTLTYLWKGGQWEVDTNHNALITTGNAGEKPSRVQFTIVYDEGSKKYELPIRTLQPGEAMMVNVAKLIQDQVPDKKGNRLPIDLTAGAYEYEDIDDNLVGYLYEGKQAIDLTNGHVAYGCALCCYKDDWYNTLFLGDTGFTGPIDIKVSDSCTGQYTTNTTSGYSWSSLDGTVATVAPGSGSAVAPGQTYSSSLINLKTFQGGKLCSLKTQNSSGPARVRPVISGPNIVWWFNGETPQYYDTQITLTATGGNGVVWGVIAGSEKVSVSPTGNTLTVRSSGSAFSASPGDIQITAQANLETSTPFSLTTKRPYLLTGKQTIPPSGASCDANYGYLTMISYVSMDQLLVAPMAAGVDWNEKWTTPLDNSLYPGTNWGRPFEVGDTNPGQYVVDNISGVGVNNIPASVPTPICGGTPSAVQQWGQDFYIGNINSGRGVRVQSDTLVRFNNHAEHQNTLSPPQ